MKGLKHRAGGDARAAALMVLHNVIFNGVDSQSALSRQLDESTLVPTDKSLCTELVYGTLRYHMRLNWFLRRKLAKPDKLPQEAFLALELATHELAHTRIPAHASVNWAVELVRHRFGKGLAGVVNAVLRGFERQKDQEYLNPQFYCNELKIDDKSSDFLSVYYAMPQWITDLWLSEYGYDNTLILLKSGLDHSIPAFRLNAAKADYKVLRDVFMNEPAAIAVGPHLVALPEGHRQPLKLLQKEGRASRQSAAAYEALWALWFMAGGKDAVNISASGWSQQGESYLKHHAAADALVWDACCGRGGKTFALLEAGVKVVCASDSAKGRISALPDEFARLGLDASSTEILCQSAQKCTFKGIFDLVLIDAPCSGLGTLAHRPEIRWRRGQEDIKRLANTQAEILDAAVNALKDKGQIIYMTCTLTAQENTLQIQSFLKRHPEFTASKAWQSPLDTANFGELFWGCVLTRA